VLIVSRRGIIAQFADADAHYSAGIQRPALRLLWAFVLIDVAWTWIQHVAMAGSIRLFISASYFVTSLSRAGPSCD
jgi:hypothetical protein